MGRKGSWFSAVTRAIGCESKDKNKTRKLGRAGRCFGKQRSIGSDCGNAVEVAVATANSDIKLIEAENEQNRHAYSVALVTAMAAEAAVAAAHAAAEVVRLRAATCSKMQEEEEAAVRIQAAFRCYLARRALRGHARLRSLIGGHSLIRQAAEMLKRMQTMARVQAEVRIWRIRGSSALVQQQIQHKHELAVEKFRESSVAEKWDDSTQSKEQIEANLHNRHEAATRRERAFAYAYSHQKTWRHAANQTFMDPNNPRWGWNWLERWMAARSGEAAADLVPARSSNTCSSVWGPAARKRARPPSEQSPLTPEIRPVTCIRGATVGLSTGRDSKSMNSSTQSGQFPRHSAAGSALRDDDSQTATSRATVPSYMASTESTRAKLRSPSPLRQGKLRICDDKAYSGRSSAKKRLSFSGCSPGSIHTRHSIDIAHSNNTS